MSKNKKFPPEYNDIYQLISELIKQELKEYNAMSTGAVSGYTGPLGMNTKPGHKILWSNPPRDNSVKKEQLEIEYPYGDPDVIQGMMGTDSGPIIQPRHLAGAVDTGGTKRRGTTVGDKLKERNSVLSKHEKEEPSSKLPDKNKAFNINAGGVLAKSIEQDVFDMIQQSYSKIGGNATIQAPGDLYQYPSWAVADVDQDPEPDVARLSKPSGAKGFKGGAIATDGSPEAKNFLLNMLKQFYNQIGNWSEVSDAMAHILLNKLGISSIKDETQVKTLLKGKNIQWHGEHPEGKFPGTYGWYTREIEGVPHTKIIVGNKLKENVLDQQGHKYVGKNYRLGSETYLQKDEPQKKRETAIIKAVNKNINKGKWGKKNMLKDPPSMGISLEEKKEKI